MSVHPTAIVTPGAKLHPTVEVGPYAVIGPRVEIGAGTTVGPHAVIEGRTRLGERNKVFQFASVGAQPQDLKYAGEDSALEIGDENLIREFTTLHKGTAGGGGVTRIGNGNLFMAYAHVAHDCHIGSNTIFANNATLAGHVEIGDHSTVGAFSAVHQFCRVGEHAFIGGGSICTQDVLPFVKTVGNRPAKTYGINTIGLQRKGFLPETIEALQRAYRILIRSKLKLEDALARIENELGYFAEARYLVEFVRESKRGIIR